MLVKTICSLVLVGCLCTAFGEDTLIYKIEVMKDTIYIGEPITVRCKLINECDRDVAILAYQCPSLLEFDFTGFHLYDPSNDREYEYGVWVHTSLIRPPDKFLLAPKDSVYYYIIFSWGGFLFLKYEDVKPGYYRIRSTYLSLESNVDSFYAEIMPANEKSVFEQVGTLVDEFWSWPQGGRSETSDKILKILPKIIKEQKSVLIPFCYYILWKESLASRADESKITFYADEFFKRYLNSPLMEKFTFDLYRYYAWYKKDTVKGKSVVLEALERYPDNLDGYLYLGLKNKKEKLK